MLKKLFGRDDNNASAPEPIIDQPCAAVNPERAQRAAESILENEALAADAGIAVTSEPYRYRPVNWQGVYYLEEDRS